MSNRQIMLFQREQAYVNIVVFDTMIRNKKVCHYKPELNSFTLADVKKIKEALNQIKTALIVSVIFLHLYTFATVVLACLLLCAVCPTAFLAISAHSRLSIVNLLIECICCHQMVILKIFINNAKQRRNGWKNEHSMDFLNRMGPPPSYRNKYHRIMWSVTYVKGVTPVQPLAA